MVASSTWNISEGYGEYSPRDIVVYIDDILVTGKINEKHLANLRIVLQCLQDGGLRLRKSKCLFMMPSHLP